MQIRSSNRSGRNAFTIAEMVVCFAIMALVISGVLMAYVNAARFTVRAGYNLAAQAQAVQILERVRAAVWDTQTTPVVDNTTNMPAFTTTNILELPMSGTNAVWCTNFLAVSTITVSTNPFVTIKMIQVNTFWPWNGAVCSNSVVAYRAPDQ